MTYRWCADDVSFCGQHMRMHRWHTDDVETTSGWRADDVHGRHAQMTCADDVRVTPGVVLHEIGQLRQVFAWVSAINLTSNNQRSGKSDKRILAWVSAINLTSNNQRSGKSDKRKPSWTALHKDECLTCYSFISPVCFDLLHLKTFCILSKKMATFFLMFSLNSLNSVTKNIIL